MNEDFASEAELARSKTRELNAELAQSAKLGKQFASVMVSAFQGIALKGKSLGDVFKSLTMSLSQMVLKAAFKPLENALGNAFGGLFAGAGFAKGAAFQNAMPVPFAKGGVISSPIAFPLGKGGTGIAGEAGAEAIMPLARGQDGRLGVAASGAGGGINVVFNVEATDADSFMRSESQVAAMLARAVSRGQRNL